MINKLKSKAALHKTTLKKKLKTTKKEFLVEEDENQEEVNCGSDRVMKNLVPLIRTPLKKEILFPNSNSKPDTKALLLHLKREGKLNKDDVITIVRAARKILRKENNLIKLSSPVVIFGDLHGQFFDLVNYIETIGDCDPETNKFLFLGDYVDRGVFGIEIVIYLNHESRQLTSFFNFRDEVIAKYDEKIYKEIMKTFDCLPLAAIVDKQFFCVHGGISPKLKKVEALNKINRFKEPPTKGLFGDLLWSDPHPNYDKPKLTPRFFETNESRSCSVFYSFQAVRRFLLINKLTCVIRGHEAQDEGFKMYLKRKETKFPSLITIFSSPNYIGVYDNKAALFKYQPNAVTIKEFQSVDQPYWLPRFIDVFAWSIPFLVEKTKSVLKTIVALKEPEPLNLLNGLNLIMEEDDDEEEYSGNYNEKYAKSGTNKNKIKNIKTEQTEKDINSDNNIFLSMKRGEIIKAKISLLLVLMHDFNKIREKKSSYLLKARGFRNVRRGHSIMISSVLERNAQNPFQIQKTTTARKKGLLRSISFQEFDLESNLLKKLLGKTISINGINLKSNGKLNISDSNTKSIKNDSSNQILEEEIENSLENEKEIEELSYENQIQNNNIPEVIEIERAEEHISKNFDLKLELLKNNQQKNLCK
ncbi:serine/threonine-protein phosphatase 2b catalytic subunit 1-related [Anaeramoeba flamelloides]|uniref:Serine/threonine-protein phosphatase 2b catalytic subunit 1-related n=1 Tax=Anaeramoeba flamelloides TaxID=1746091 RepID=A0ABQ8XM64_9EUKA|nr:serine/threonine-protein phosphatase 2b catalytic subunit 1-related [Anaeramoeba flamelloides]